MVDSTARPQQKGFLGRVAGAVTGRVVDVVDPDIVLGAVDLNTLLEKVDVQRVLERIDLNPVLREVDLNALLSRVDLDAVLGELDLEALLTKVDLDKVLSQVDLNALLTDVDVEALVRRSGIPEIVADSTSQLAGSTLDVVRRQLAALDFWINRAVDTLMRRTPGSVPLAPSGLANTSTPTEVSGRREVTGHYAGPVGRALAYALDTVVVTLIYTGTGATFDWLARTFLDQSLVSDVETWVSAVILTTWSFVYFFGSLAVAGRTPGQALVGLRVVTRDGATLPPLSAFLRTLCLPVSFLLLGLGLVGVVIGREHRALHDVAGRSAVVLDFGDRPAELPGPLSKFLDRQEL
jgi:uncharacterized RDD family membrane protein YckC